MRARPTHARTRRYAAAAATTSAVVAAVGLGTAPAAQSAPDDQCPAAAPVSGLTPGDPVTGKTVTSGTEPETFGGSVVGTLEDGIAPGVDMVLVDLDSPTITRVGIWSGMSGSPVYDADGDLIGAVSYSLGLGPSTVAGVTPATEMLKLLRSTPTLAAAPRATSARLSSALRQDIAETGGRLGRGQHDDDPAPGPGRDVRPLTARLKRVAPALNGQGMHVADAPAGPTSSEPIDVAAGGNLAASMSYGTITAAGVGTATAVCGDEVLAFGHPMNFTGPATMSLQRRPRPPRTTRPERQAPRPPPPSPPPPPPPPPTPTLQEPALQTHAARDRGSRARAAGTLRGGRWGRTATVEPPSDVVAPPVGPAAPSSEAPQAAKSSRNEIRWDPPRRRWAGGGAEPAQRLSAPGAPGSGDGGDRVTKGWRSVRGD